MSISLGDIAALGQARNYPSKANDFGRTLQVFADAVENGTATFTNKTLTSPTLTGTVTVTGDCDITGDLTVTGAIAGTIGFAKASVGYAALNTATTGVAAPIGDVVPSGATVVRAWAKVTEAFTDVGTAGNANTSTVSVGVEDQDVDIQAAAAVSGAPWSGTANVAFSALVYGTPDITEFRTVTADRQIAITWDAGSGDATALATGAMDIYVEYVY